MINILPKVCDPLVGEICASISSNHVHLKTNSYSSSYTMYTSSGRTIMCRFWIEKYADGGVYVHLYINAWRKRSFPS